jgi:hypothetical protein
MTRLRTPLLHALALALLVCSTARSETPAVPPVPAVRVPAVPLITHNPYFSVWSTNDRPTDDFSRHWTGAIQAMCGLVRVDGQPFRILGPKPSTVPAMKMAGLEITPTRTTYTMEAGGIRVFMTFMSPLLPFDENVLARPVTYLSWTAQSTDGEFHDVSLYFDATGEFAVNTPDQKVTWQRDHAGKLEWLRIGTSDQPVLAKAGDNLRIDWGYFYVAAPRSGGMTSAIAADVACREGFAGSGKLPAGDDKKSPRPARQDWPVLAYSFDIGRVGDYPQSRHVLLAYDELNTVEYMGQKLDPLWRGEGWDVSDLLRAAESDYVSLKVRCADFDNELTSDMERLGGKEYARLGALAYRQCLAAHTIAKGQFGRPLVFSKENFSNGCIATVDVTYPSSPFFLLFNPRLLRGQLIPVLEYARSDKWKFPFAPHDLGTYPKANGQVYGGGEKTEKDQMPVEECGNMLIMVAALAKAEGSAEFACQYWPVLETWAKYLREKGLDPENQLCTDDFAGHLAHNTNLSLKAIEALGGYAMLCQMSGRDTEAADFRKAAQEMATRWASMALDGDHYRLAFDKPETWSQKYNLVWDKLLGLDLFPPEVARREVAFYLTHQGKFGLPLDNRSKYTKLDWLVWTATLAESRKDFDAIVGPILKFVAESPDRVPLTDWYWTHDAKQAGFQARSVVGGIFIKMLADPVIWKKWASKQS